MTKYNLVILAKTQEELKEMEVGLKVYHDKITEFVPLVFGDNRGIKTELAKEAEWELFAPEEPVQEVARKNTTEPPVPAPPSMDQNELFRVLETSIRQKLEAEIRVSLEAEKENPERQRELLRKLKEDLELEEENRRLAIRMAMIAEGDKILTQLVMIWQQAKQNGDGGQQWNEVKQRLLELLDATVQLTRS